MYVSAKVDCNAESTWRRRFLKIIVNDNGLIKALNKYEKSMINVSDDAFKAINEVIMESYGGEI